MKRINLNCITQVKKEISDVITEIRIAEKENICGKKDAEIKMLNKLLEALTDVCICETGRFIYAIDKIEDPILKTILCLKHINGLGWQQIAFTIGGLTADEAKLKHDIFLKNYLRREKY